jgi:hypothetical protein
VETVAETEAMTVPANYGDAPLPKRSSPRGLLPSTWLGRSCGVGYVGVDGQGVETSGILLDYYGCGPVFNLAGGRVLVAWDRLVSVELANS